MNRNDNENMNAENFEIIDINTCEIVDMNEDKKCSKILKETSEYNKCPFRKNIKKFALLGSFIIFIIAVITFLNLNKLGFKNTYSSSIEKFSSLFKK